MSMRKWIRGLAILLGVLIVAAGVLIGLFYARTKSILDNPMDAFTKTSQSMFSSNAVVSDEEGNEHVSTEGIINIALLGIDSNSWRETQHMGYRSDVMIVATINFNDNTMSMLTIPRDTRMEGITKLDYKTGEVVDTTTNRLNTAYTFGGGPNKFGAENAMNNISAFLSCGGKFDVPIDYYVSLDMDGILEFAKVVGDVQVTLDRDLKDYGKKGDVITLNANNIDMYLRNRKTGGGDDGRSARQMDYIMAALKKLKEGGGLASKAPALFSAFTNYGRTNLDLDQIVALAKFADGFDLDSVKIYRATGETKDENGRSYYIIDMNALSEYIIEVLYDPNH